MATEKTKITPPELAKMWGISPHKVHTWIRSGELRAINVSGNLCQRARWLIDTCDIEDFEKRRENVRPKRATQPAVKRRRRRAIRGTTMCPDGVEREVDEDGVIQFY